MKPTTILILIVVVNASSYFIVSRFNKGIRLRGVRRSVRGLPTYYLIGGRMTRGKEAFDWLPFDMLEGGITVVEYQNFGFDPRVAAEDIRHYLDYNYRQPVFISMSIGCQTAMYTNQVMYQHLLINPCLGKETLKENVMTTLGIVLPFLEVICFFLGWICYLPIIPIKGGQWYSISLWLDQWKAANCSTDLDLVASADGLITSLYDEIVDNEAINEAVRVNKQSCKKTIPGKHVDVKKFNVEYAMAVAYILDHWDYRYF